MKMLRLMLGLLFFFCVIHLAVAQSATVARSDASINVASSSGGSAIAPGNPKSTQKNSDTKDVTNVQVCSAVEMARLNEVQRIQAMQIPLDAAVATIDNAKIEFSSPTLASDKMNYVTITPNFADNLQRLCIIGYFYETEDAESHEPLKVDHVEIIRQINPNDTTKTIDATRIFFHAPSPRDFEHMRKDIFWRFWDKDDPIRLKFAAFDYDHDKAERTKTYFGHNIPVALSHPRANVFAAFLFGISCYLFAALTVSYRAERTVVEEPLPAGQTRGQSRLRRWLKRISPWYMVGSSGEASLSQLQMLLFTLIVATLLFYQWSRTGLLQELSTDLLYLMGISTLGAGGAQVANSVKKNLDAGVYDYIQRLGWFTAPMVGGHDTAVPSQLLLTNSRFDIYKFQMLVFTLVIAAYVIAAGGDQLGNIQISGTLLSLMGMSQGVYISGHFASDNISALQDQLRGMQAIQTQYLACDNAEGKTLLAARFATAAEQAADMFCTLFHREIPPEMLKVQNSVLGGDVPKIEEAVVIPT